jgi:murein DD-endopeptidase MepM/ murein hydrolase activator NlpD
MQDSQERKSEPGFLKRLVIASLNVVTILTLAALGFIAWFRLPGLLDKLSNSNSTSAVANIELTETVPGTQDNDQEPAQILGSDTNLNIKLANLPANDLTIIDGIHRLPLLNTTIPNRPRVDVITYTVETGDSLFSIADTFNLKPETILWGNFETLEDNPHLLSKDQVLNILPTDGVYYQWNAGDTINGVASFFQVDSNAIISYPGNRIDLTATGAGDTAIESGTWVIVPGGKRLLKDWGPPAISRSNPASARYYGDGYCGSVYEGAIGNGTFVWPTTAQSISGYGYSGIHPAIDIAGAVGNAVFASDSGVVVFAGWSNYGYGYMVVIDHGTGWQTAYAHLSAVAVTCGQSVFQGGYIGAVGSTGNSTGAHLHFEMVYNGAKPNPLNYLP